MDHPHEHYHDHSHGHDPHGDHSLLHRISHALTPHSHDYQTAALDAALATDRGIWAVKVSLIVLLANGLQIGDAGTLADLIRQAIQDGECPTGVYATDKYVFRADESMVELIYTVPRRP